MAKIVVAPYGSLGDLHPFIALARELRTRGHEVTVASLEVYREKIDALGFEFRSLRPDFDPEDREVARLVMDTNRGTERLIRDYLSPGFREMYDDLMSATEEAELLIPGEIVYPAYSVAEKRGLKMATTSLAPLSMFSTYEPNVYPNAQFLKALNFLGRPLHRIVFYSMNRVLDGWLEPYREFRSEIGLDPEHDPIVSDKFSKELHLAMFSRVLGAPQPDWPDSAVQTGFCFYDGCDDLGKMPDGLEEFLDSGEPPIVFTLGSAAVMDAGNFFEEGLEAARMLNQRAVALYGIFNEPPAGTDRERTAFDYAPYGQLFSRAACVVHQGGVGTTAQVLLAGVPHLIMPFSHDQPDNAARCERLGVARTIFRDAYDRTSAATEIDRILDDGKYRSYAETAKQVLSEENGTVSACDAIEDLL
ncbi:MAG: glycosyltransferase [Acidobacteria bacterium]|nr:MAG: glycosyltransferase [Acidobacteriota bacterium]REK03934.1 MAG: glycosyltransferase [Acidobacteriota bacterium]REK15096.1 MAG: glycosyltransferase [Acidobacteriota bacterium]REK46186.1 MAG: glycosyltransferase [Acidobacteriota bacterium]